METQVIDRPPEPPEAMPPPSVLAHELDGMAMKKSDRRVTAEAVFDLILILIGFLAVVYAIFGIVLEVLAR